jgi:hypothetical protein
MISLLLSRSFLRYKIGVAQMKTANKAAAPFKKGSSPKKSKK